MLPLESSIFFPPHFSFIHTQDIRHSQIIYLGRSSVHLLSILQPDEKRCLDNRSGRRQPYIVVTPKELCCLLQATCAKRLDKRMPLEETQQDSRNGSSRRSFHGERIAPPVPLHNTTFCTRPRCRAHFVFSPSVICGWFSMILVVVHWQCGLGRVMSGCGYCV